MDAEQRIALLESQMTNIGLTLRTLTFVVEAIIEAHPAPDTVGAQLEILAEHKLTYLRDHGFEQGLEVRYPLQAQNMLRTEIDHWLRLITVAQARPRPAAGKP